MNTFRRISLAVAILPAALGACSGNLDDTNLLIATMERISLDSTGAEVFGASSVPAMSADGRFVAFQSASPSLVAGDSNGANDVFLRDTLAGTTIRVSAEASASGGFPNGPDGVADGSNATGASGNPAISANGQFIAFESDAIDLLLDTPKPPGQTDIYVRDLSFSNKTELISVPTAGIFANGPSSSPSISPDGRYVAFVSVATNLTADAVSGTIQHVFIWDRTNSSMELVSRHTSGAIGNSASTQPCVSDTGSNGPTGVFVVFQSASGNLVTGAGAATAVTHIFRKAVPGGAAEMVDAVNPGLTPSDGSSQTPFITPDGRFVALRSAGTILAAVDVNGADDIFVRDMSIAPAGLMTLVSQLPSGIQAGGASMLPCLSPDGRYVVFSSFAPNLVSGDTNGQPDVFWRDLQSSGPGSLQRINVATFGQQSVTAAGTSSSGRTVMSADGRFVVIATNAADLVNGDTNGSSDIFVRGPLH